MAGLKRILFLLTFLPTLLYAEKIELIISSGLSYDIMHAFSPNSKYLVSGLTKKFNVWDIKSGRKIREFVLPENNAIYSPDTLWFEGPEQVRIRLRSTNDTYLANIRTGEVTLAKSDVPYDWSTAKQVVIDYYKLQLYLDSTSMEDRFVTAPNGNYRVVYKKIKFDKVNMYGKKYAFRIMLEKDGKGQYTNDTLFYFSNYKFSEDSRYFFQGNKIYDLVDQRRISSFKIAPFAGMGVGFVPGTHIPVTCGVNNVRIWDFPNIRSIPMQNLSDIIAMPGYKKYLFQIYSQKPKDHEFHVYEMDSDSILKILKIPNYTVAPSNISKDGKRFAIKSYPIDASGKMSFNGTVYDLEKGKSIEKYENTNTLYVTEDPNWVIKDSASGFSMMYNRKKDLYRGILSDPGDPMFKYYRPYPYAMSNDNAFVFGMKSEVQNPGEYKNRVMVWDVLNNKEFFSVLLDGTPFGFEVSSDHQYFACGANHSIYVFDMKTGKKVWELQGHSAWIMKMAFSDDNKRLISASTDGTRRVWNLENGKEMVSLVATGENDYAIVTPDQYYYSTKGANDAIHFVKGMKIFPFEQFDLKYNRPDIILKRLAFANTDPNLIRSYNLAYQKRLKKSGFTEEMLSGEFHLPETSITNVTDFGITSTKRNIDLSIAASDSKYNLDRLMVRVNGVPLDGQMGMSLRGQNKKTVHKKIPIDLSTGINKISVSTLNEKGVESIADNFEINYEPSVVQKPDLYLITLGVSHYSATEYDLKYASKDANDFSHLFEGQHAPFENVVTHNLVDDQVNPTALSELKEELKKTSVDDAVLVFFAGHGVLDQDLNYYLASSKMAFNDPSKGGIPYETLENLLDGIPSRHKVMLLDACHSGEIDKDEVVLAKKEEVVTENVTFRSVGGTGLKTVGLNNSFELMKELFTDLRKSNGAIIISSAGGTEFAMEGDQWKNGVFTYSLLHGLKSGEADLNGDKQVMMTEINSYIRKEVERLTHGMQHPTNRTETLEVDWRLW